MRKDGVSTRWRGTGGIRLSWQPGINGAMATSRAHNTQTQHAHPCSRSSPLLLPDDAAGGVKVHRQHFAYQGLGGAVLIDSEAILRAGEGWGLIGILHRDPDSSHILEGALANVLGVNERVGGLHSEGVRAAGFKIQRLPDRGWKEGEIKRD